MSIVWLNFFRSIDYSITVIFNRYQDLDKIASISQMSTKYLNKCFAPRYVDVMAGKAINIVLLNYAIIVIHVLRYDLGNDPKLQVFS